MAITLSFILLVVCCDTCFSCPFSQRRTLQLAPSKCRSNCGFRLVLACEQTPSSAQKVESFSNDNHDGNENVKKAIVLLSRKTTLHVHHTFLYISLSPLHEVKMSNSTFYWGRKQETTKFSFSFLCGLQEINSGTFAYTWHFQQFGTRQSLKKYELILNVTFSLPLPSSMLKLPIFFLGGGGEGGICAQAILYSLSTWHHSRREQRHCFELCGTSNVHVIVFS